MDNFLLIFDNVLEENLVDRLNKAIIDEQLENPLNFVKKDELNNCEHPSSAVNLVHEVIDELWFDKLSFLDDDSIQGFESWFNLMKDGSGRFTDGLHLHVDCDEKYYHDNLTILPPKYTLVFYAGPKNSIVGGELAINLNGQEYFNDNTINSWLDKNAGIQQQPEKIKKDTKNWITIPYKYNRLVVFDPKYPHCVLDVESGTENQGRSTFTIAAWDKEIEVLR